MQGGEEEVSGAYWKVCEHCRRVANAADDALSSTVDRARVVELADTLV